MSDILEPAGGPSASPGSMPAPDLSRVLYEYALAPLRDALRVAGSRVLIIEGRAGVSELADSPTVVDAVWLQLETLVGLDYRPLADGVARVLRPGGVLVCVTPGDRPLLRRACRSRHAVAPAAGTVTARRLRRELARAIAWRRSRALGVLVPPSACWPRIGPLALGLLAAGEEIVAGWPVARALGEWTVDEGVRR